MKAITSLSQFQELIASKATFFLYKHSTTCNISSKACRNVDNIMQALHIREAYIVDVHQTGTLKYDIANIVGVRHESPQVLIFSKGTLIAHASHMSITIGWFHQHLLGWNDTRKNH